MCGVGTLTFITKENKRRLLAAFFLLFFVGELGSHMVFCINHMSADDLSVFSHDDSHDDPCKTLAVCSDGTRKDQQAPNLAHDITFHNALFDHLSSLIPQTGVPKDAAIPFTTGHSLFRPPSPPFHPPELS